MPVTHNKGPLPPNHPFAKGLIVSGQKRPGTSRNSSVEPPSDEFGILPTKAEVDELAATKGMESAEFMDAMDRLMRHDFKVKAERRMAGTAPSTKNET